MPILIRSEIHSTPYNTSTIDGYSTIQYNTSTIDGYSTIQYNTSTIDGYREIYQLYTTLKSLMSFPKCGLPFFTFKIDGDIRKFSRFQFIKHQ